MRTRREKGKAHIVRYELAQGITRPVWLPFPGPDAERPARSAAAIRSKRYRVRRPEPARDADSKVKLRVRPIVIPPQHEVIRALFGLGVLG